MNSYKLSKICLQIFAIVYIITLILKAVTHLYTSKIAFPYLMFYLILVNANKQIEFDTRTDYQPGKDTLDFLEVFIISITTIIIVFSLLEIISVFFTITILGIVYGTWFIFCKLYVQNINKKRKNKI